MRKIITITFVTMDGVMQAPGGPEEDASNGFKYGGWQMGLPEDEEAAGIINKFFKTSFELLLGRRTYDIFSGYWPFHEEIEDVAKPFNSTKKYVVSHESIELPWNNSELVTEDVVSKIKELKEMDGPDLHVWGSSNLIQTMLKNNLIDQMNLFIYPVTIGSGKKLFEDGTQPKSFKLVESQITPTGVIYASYEPSGPLVTGSVE
jgi:dihydrofolate reductase